MTKPLIYFILRHPEKPMILVEERARGRGLPSVEWRGRGFMPNQVRAIIQAIRQKYGLDATVLRHLADCGENQVCEVESRDESAAMPRGTEWLEWAAALSLSAEPGLGQVLRAAMSGERRGSPWQNRGWLRQAETWIRAQLQREWTPDSTIFVEKSAWNASCVLRIETTRRLYFKACYLEGASEVAVISALAQSHPSFVPELVACEPERRWMIMEDFGAEELDARPPEDWALAAGAFAELQLAAAGRLATWAHLGCPVRDAARIAAALEDLIEQEAQLAHGESLGGTERAALRAALPAVRDNLRALEAAGVPQTLCLQDFRDGNIAVSGDSYIFYDWSDAVVAHPFFCAHRMIEFAAPAQGGDAAVEAGRAAAVKEGYTRAFAACDSPDGLDRAFDLAGELYPAYCAAWWHINGALMGENDPYRSALADLARANLRALLRGPRENGQAAL